MHNNYYIRILIAQYSAGERGDCSRYDLSSNVESRSENNDNSPWTDYIILFVMNTKFDINDGNDEISTEHNIKLFKCLM